MIMMSGMGSWLEAGVDKRQLGMSVATVLLEKSGDQVPEWTLEHTETLEQLRSLSSGHRTVEQRRYDVDLETWSEEGRKQVNTLF